MKTHTLGVGQFTEFMKGIKHEMNMMRTVEIPMKCICAACANAVAMGLNPI